MKIRPKLPVLVSASLLPAWILSGGALAQPDEITCPQTSAPIVYGTGTLDSEVEGKDGVVYVEDMGVGRLSLMRAGGDFRSAPTFLFDLSIYTAAGDFDGDGWDDFVSGDLSGITLVYQNTSSLFLLPPNAWDDPTFTLTPDFWPMTSLGQDPNGNYHMVLAAGDFNGDGWADIFRANATLGTAPADAHMWLNAQVFGFPTFGLPYDPLAPGTTGPDLGQMNWGGTNAVVVDYNGDRKLDLLIGSGETDGGSIRIFLNNCTLQNPLPPSPPAPPAPLPCVDSPTFSYFGPLVENMGMGGNGIGELAVFAYEDFDGDGLRDIIAGSPNCCATASERLQMWRGVAGGGVEATPSQSITFPGAATAVLAADYTLDGRMDLVVGTDGLNYGAPAIGGKTFFYENDATATPFSGGYKSQLTDNNAPLADLDVGMVFNYDNDPDNTPDVLIADGNGFSAFLVLANRTVNTFVECGEAISGIIDLGPLAGTEMVITSARLAPAITLNDGTVSFFMSNEDPPNWVPANDCGDGSGDVCAVFPRPVGTEVRWKAVICSNADNTQTPDISGLTLRFDYTEALEHLRGGVIVYDGVAYMGTFSQPGDRGRFHAINTGFDQTYWEFSTKLDLMNDSDRNIYTSSVAGDTRLDFRWMNDSNNDDALVTALGAADQTQAEDVINWVRGARFGVGNLGSPRTKLGAVETSTPAIVNKPGLPIWYTRAGTDDRRAVDTFMSEYSDRKVFALFGSKDGMLHAVRNDATNIGDLKNGTEAWAFIPVKVAAGMLADYTASLGGTTNVSSFPDGSPSIADVKIGGDLRTVAVVASGNGGKSIAAMDITETIDPVDDSVSGPQPLWHATPGDADAGQSFAKPVIARVDIAGQERFIAIAGTGLAYDNVVPPYTKGRTVIAYDIADGSPLWKFQTECPLTSHLAVFETDDELESGAPELDGFMDRLVFADKCGYVYKLDPARDLGGDWNDNDGHGSIATSVVDGKQLYALFSTTGTVGALGEERPIAGTLGIRSDASTRVIVFFGTGGLEDYDPTLVNEFYAVYADDGSIRSKMTGACNAGKCEKFYGGVVVTTEQVIFTRATDREVGTGLCDNGSSYVDIMQLDADADNEFVRDSAPIAISGAAVGSMYGDADAVYVATISGDVVRIGTPRVTSAGADTANGNVGGLGGGEEGTMGSNDPLVLMGWRQIF